MAQIPFRYNLADGQLIQSIEGGLVDYSAAQRIIEDLETRLDKSQANEASANEQLSHAIAEWHSASARVDELVNKLEEAESLARDMGNDLEMRSE